MIYGIGGSRCVLISAHHTGVMCTREPIQLASSKQKFPANELKSQIECYNCVLGYRRQSTLFSSDAFVLLADVLLRYGNLSRYFRQRFWCNLRSVMSDISWIFMKFLSARRLMNSISCKQLVVNWKWPVLTRELPTAWTLVYLHRIFIHYGLSQRKNHERFLANNLYHVLFDSCKVPALILAANSTPHMNYVPAWKTCDELFNLLKAPWKSPLAYRSWGFEYWQKTKK